VFIQLAAPTHVLFDADPGENGTRYIEGNRTLISLNLSRMSEVLLSLFINVKLTVFVSSTIASACF